jgi:predicted 3-demethylubiquinone-9 3-methyltransferase (glyoxalase superfamily)
MFQNIVNHQKITICLVFNNQAEDAVKFYTSVLKDSKILYITRFSEDEIKALSHLPEDIRPQSVGSVKTITLELLGQKAVAVNGGSYFKFSEGISLVINCDTQKEIDELWEKLSEGGEKQDCGWIKDKFGVSWQIVPTVLESMVNDPDSKRSEKMIVALYKMKKIDIETLQQAYG